MQRTPIVKKKAIVEEMVQSGLNACEASRRFGVPRSTLRQWVNQAANGAFDDPLRAISSSVPMNIKEIDNQIKELKAMKSMIETAARLGYILSKQEDG